jgi:hypothetical protein
MFTCILADAISYSEEVADANILDGAVGEGSTEEAASAASLRSLAKYYSARYNALEVLAYS